MFHLLAITAGSDGSSNFFGDAPEVAVGLELHMTLKGKNVTSKLVGRRLFRFMQYCLQLSNL